MYRFNKFLRAILIALLISSIFFGEKTAYGQQTASKNSVMLPAQVWDLPLKVLNHPSDQSTMTLKDFSHKKLIILDFWATWCGACISMFDKTHQLQAQYEKEMVFIPVTYESMDLVNAFFQRRKSRDKKAEDLFTVYDNRILQKIFPHRMMPHYVWITGDGKVLGSSNGDQITEANIQAALNGQVTFSQKTDVRIPYEATTSILKAMNGLDDTDLNSYSFFGKYKPGLSAGMRTGKLTDDFNRITCLNVSLSAMITTAYSRADRLYVRNQIKFLASDSTLINAPKDPVEYIEWKKENAYCYEIVGKQHVSELRKFMQEDLKRNFPQLTIETQFITQPCWVMKGSTQNPKLKSSGGKRVSVIDINGCTLKNSSLFDLFFQMKLFLFQNSQIPLEYELTDDFPVDLEFFADMTNMEEINKALSKYGIQFVLEERAVETVVVTDRLVSKTAK